MPGETQMKIKEKWGIIYVVMFFSIVVSIQTHLMASLVDIDEAVKVVADRLESEQVKESENKGTWLDNMEFTGSITVGMVDAYNRTGENSYWASAELAGDYILRISNGNLYSDEALALTRLSDFATDPLNNIWRTTVSNFYSNIKQSSSGTQDYIALYEGLEPSAVVLYLAEHVVAAYSVGAEDIEIWRQSLVDWLSQVDDDCSFPVLALGSATWALAQTGRLDETLIDPSGEGTSYWNLKRLENLPSLLLSHQVPEGQPMAGSFYWRFDHGDGGWSIPISGFTEDTIYATLGLAAFYYANPVQNDSNLESALSAARSALMNSISPKGWVWEHLSQNGIVCCVYAGEMLQVLCELDISDDL